MARKMQVAVVEQFGKPLVLQRSGHSVAWRRPDSGQDRGLRGVPHRSPCRDRRLAAEAQAAIHSRATKPSAASRRVGAGVTIVKEGDRVGVPWLYSACGHCEHCLAAWETVCAEAEFGGYTKNGGFAEYSSPIRTTSPIFRPDLDPKQAAPLICAGITTYKGIKETKAKARRMDRHLRRRRPRASCHSICQGHGPSGLRGRHR